MSAPCPVFGFVVRLRGEREVDPEALVSALHREILEPRGLEGRIAVDNREIVITGEGCQATDADRDVVVAWLSRRRDLSWFEVGALEDVSSLA